MRSTGSLGMFSKSQKVLACNFDPKGCKQEVNIIRALRAPHPAYDRVKEVKQICKQLNQL